MNQAILDEALLLQAIGYDIILVDATTKNPGIVKDWPNHKWPESELRIWLSRRPDLSLALRLGDVIDVEIDAENEEQRARWEKDFLAQLPPGFSTPSWSSKRGRHWLFRLSGQQRSELLSKSAPSTVKGHTLEFRLGFKPAQSLLPTPCNDYRSWIDAPTSVDVAELPDTVYQALLRALPVKEQHAPRDVSQNQRPGDIFNESVSWEEILLPHEWTHVGGDKWCRPGKRGEVSATTGYCSSENRGELFYCFSTADEVEPIEPQKAYSKFELWTCLNHGGDFRAAAVAALRSGYSPDVEHHDGSEFPEIEDFPEPEIVKKQETKPKLKKSKHPRLDLHQFNDPLTAYCLALEHKSAADIGAIWFQLHELFANFIGRNPHFTWSGKDYFANGSLFVVGPTATGKKGLSLSAAKAAFDPAVCGEFSDDIEFSTYEPLIAGGWQSGQAIVTHFIKGKDEIGEIDKRLMMVEEETATILKMAKLENSILSQVMRTAFDGGSLEYRVSKVKGTAATVCVKDIQVSLIGHITESELLQLLTAGADKTGELNRIQFILCLDSKFVPESRSNFRYKDIPELTSLRAHMLNCLKWAKQRRIMFNEELYQLLDDYTERHDLDMRAGKEKPINARLPLYLRKWITRFAVLDMSEVADITHYTKAMAVVDYLRAANDYLLGEWVDGVDKDLIDKAICVIEESPTGASRAEIGRALFGGHWTVEKIDSLIKYAAAKVESTGHKLQSRKNRNKVIYFVE